MIVGACVVELHIHGCRSLKARRGVVRSITQRVRNRFNLSVAEVGGQDTWQRAVIGIAAAGTDATGVRRVLERAADFIEDLHLAEVCYVDFEVLDLPQEEPFHVEDEEGEGADGARDGDREDEDEAEGR